MPEHRCNETSPSVVLYAGDWAVEERLAAWGTSQGSTGAVAFEDTFSISADEIIYQLNHTIIAKLTCIDARTSTERRTARHNIIRHDEPSRLVRGSMNQSSSG